MRVAQYFNHHNKALDLQPDQSLPLPRCPMGLEWEFEAAAHLREALGARNNKYFLVHEDGSLRDQGMEVVTVGDGIWGVDLIKAIDYLYGLIGQLAMVGRAPVCNYRTAFHVHLDIRDVDAPIIHNILLLYSLLEIPIFNFVGKNRFDSNFCVPWGRSESQFAVLKALKDGMKPSDAEKIRHLQRYSALNCQAIAKYGTLEFRHMQNDIGEIKTKQVEFIKIVQKLKKSAIEAYEKGLHGQAFFEHLKQLNPAELCNMTDLRVLPTNDWDYVEALIQTAGIVDFPIQKTNDFYDNLYKPFLGNHPNWK